MARQRTAKQLAHDKKIAELGKKTQIKPGQVLNPLGRPKQIKYISEYLREMSQEKCTDSSHNHQDDADNNICIATRLIMAAKGIFSEIGKPDMTAFDAFADRTEGPVEKKMAVRLAPDLDCTIDELCDRVKNRNADEPKK